MQLSKSRRYRPLTLSSWMDDFFNDRFQGFNNEGNFSTPAVNVRDHDNSYELQVAAPGLKREDFHVDLNDNVLTIKTEQKSESDDTNDNYSRREFSYSSFERRFQLPEGISQDDIQAKYEDGILKIDIPKMEKKEPEPRKIEIG